MRYYQSWSSKMVMDVRRQSERHPGLRELKPISKTRVLLAQISAGLWERNSVLKTNSRRDRKVPFTVGWELAGLRGYTELLCRFTLGKLDAVFFKDWHYVS